MKRQRASNRAVDTLQKSPSGVAQEMASEQGDERQTGGSAEPNARDSGQPVQSQAEHRSEQSEVGRSIRSPAATEERRHRWDCRHIGERYGGLPCPCWCHATQPRIRTDKLGDPACPYMRRWIVDLGRLGSIRLHHWYRPDDERARHDHPWGFLTIVLWGSYRDEYWMPWYAQAIREGVAPVFESDLSLDVLHAGSIRWRDALHTHRVITDGCWSLLWTQPKIRSAGLTVKRASGRWKWLKQNRFFAEYGQPPCQG